MKNKRIWFIVFLVILFLCLFCIIFLLSKDKKNVYLIEFDSNGGSIVSSQEISDGDFVVEPSNPTYYGFTFDGWYLNGKKYNFNTKVHKKMTLVAKWNIDFNITLDEDSVTEDNINDSKDTIDKSKNSIIKSNDNNKNNNEKNNNGNKNKVIHVSELSLSSKNLTLYVGQSATVGVYITPSDASYKDVDWYSSNTNVATIENGIIKGIGVGTTEIIARLDGISTSLIVNVIQKEEYKYEIVDVSSSTIGQCYIYIKNSKGNFVSGIVTITYTTGASEDVAIPVDGLLWPNKNVISSIGNIRGN